MSGGRGWINLMPPPWAVTSSEPCWWPPLEHALISLLALNGLRVSEATGADIDHLILERGHRTLTITRKGGNVVTIPLAPRTAPAVDLPIGERCDGPVFLSADERRLDRHGAGRIVRRVAQRTGISKNVGPHTLRHAFITAAKGRWGAATRRSRGCLPCRSADHDEVRPGSREPGPAPDLYRRHIHRGRRSVTRTGDGNSAWRLRPPGGLAHGHGSVTHRAPTLNANRRSVRRGR